MSSPSEIDRLRAENTMLVDLVVAAAALWFGQIEDTPARDYASEELYTAATELVATHPRLRGAFTPEDDDLEHAVARLRGAAGPITAGGTAQDRQLQQMLATIAPGTEQPPLLPEWVYNLLAAIAEHEKGHGQHHDPGCLRTALQAVPTLERSRTAVMTAVRRKNVQAMKGASS